MSAEENKVLVRRLLQDVRDGRSSAVIDEFFAPSYRRHLNPTTAPLTRAAQRAQANRLRAAFPDATATLEDIVRIVVTFEDFAEAAVCGLHQWNGGLLR